MTGKLPLTGKRALVTGGTRGIGYAIAERLRDDGAEVYVTGTGPDGKGPKRTAYWQVDFTDQASTAAFAETISTRGIDVLVNNAGINKVSPFTEIDPEDFRRVQKVNVEAPFILARAVVGGMVQRGWGRIVTIASIWGNISKAGRAPYSTSKFAVDGMTAALAAEVAGAGVLCNCVSPGFIDTDLTRQVLGDDGIAELVAQVPARRLGQPQEIAALVAWLSGPENSYISGQNILIDGGFTRV